MKLSAEERAQFKSWLEKIPQLMTDFEFFLSHADAPLQELDFGPDSIRRLEETYWLLVDGELTFIDPATDKDMFETLGATYFGETLVRSFGGKWVQSSEPNFTFGKPAIDGLGREKWQRVYPFDLFHNLDAKVRQQPQLRGARDRTPIMAAFERAIATKALVGT